MSIDTAALRALLASGGTRHLVSSAELRELVAAYERYHLLRNAPPCFSSRLRGEALDSALDEIAAKRRTN